MMITAEDTETLRTEEKDAILDAVLGMAWSDGTIAPEELSMAKSIALHLDPKVDVEALLKDYKPDNDRVSRKIAKSDLGPQGKRVMLRAMAFVAAAEGSLDDKELAFYRGCLRAFGVNEIARQRMEADVRRHVYTEMLRRKLAQDELDQAGKDELAAMRKRLEIDDKAGEEIDRQVRKFLEKK